MLVLLYFQDILLHNQINRADTASNDDFRTQIWGSSTSMMLSRELKCASIGWCVRNMWKRIKLVGKLSSSTISQNGNGVLYAVLISAPCTYARSKKGYEQANQQILCPSCVHTAQMLPMNRPGMSTSEESPFQRITSYTNGPALQERRGR